mmetsp:Transcript_51237/g.109722  ORF Transcript_51237/g.109722 Transcript_51237/m.109722 type:complete len:244 (-) Transcript_51237:674-1405(-)
MIFAVLPIIVRAVVPTADEIALMTPTIPVGQRHRDEITYQPVLLWGFYFRGLLFEGQTIHADAKGRLSVEAERHKAQKPALQSIGIVANLAQIVSNLRSHISVPFESSDRLPGSATLTSSTQLIARHPLFPTRSLRPHHHPSFTIVRTHVLSGLQRPLLLQLRTRILYRRWEAARSAHMGHAAIGPEVHLQERFGPVLNPAIETHSVVYEMVLRDILDWRVSGANPNQAVRPLGGHIRATLPI